MLPHRVHRAAALVRGATVAMRPRLLSAAAASRLRRAHNISLSGDVDSQTATFVPNDGSQPTATVVLCHGLGDTGVGRARVIYLSNPRLDLLVALGRAVEAPVGCRVRAATLSSRSLSCTVCDNSLWLDGRR